MVVVGVILANLQQLYRLVNQYLLYDTEDKFTDSIHPVRFATITVCNLDPMSATTVKHHLTGNTSSLWRLKRYNNIIDNYVREAIYKKRRDKAKTQAYGELLTSSAYYANMGPDEAKLVGHQFHDFIIDCVYEQKPCDRKWDFFPFYDSNFYNCYSFNPVLHGHGQRRHQGKYCNLTGPSNGLSMILYTESDVPNQTSVFMNRTYVEQSNAAHSGKDRRFSSSKSIFQNFFGHGFLT